MSVFQPRVLPDRARATIRFVNIAHALDHFVLLIFPTAVIAIAADMGRSYNELIWLTTGAFVAFGLCSLPVGWLADRFGRRTMLATFFFGYGASCLLVAAAFGSLALSVALLVLGVFSAVYHPIGSAMIVVNAKQLGREFGRNGVWGNLGAASASGVTAAIAVAFGWRAAFAMPGLVLIAAGIAFLTLVKDESEGSGARGATHAVSLGRRGLVTLVAALIVAIVAGGITFNVTTIALPKVIDERLGVAVSLAETGWITTAIFVCGALTQITAGRLIDRYALPAIFFWMSIMQPIGLALAAGTQGAPLVLGMVMTTSAIYGQVVILDAMIARYVAAEMRNRVYSIRYFLGFTVSGFAVPMIAALHARGGFHAVLLVTAAFGAAIFAAAVVTWLLMSRRPAGAVPAE